MNFSFKIELHRHGYGGYLYTVRIDQDEATELEKFLKNPVHRKEPEFKKLEARLNFMTDRQGFRKSFFKERESLPSNAICALHYESKGLRLYCSHSSQTLIAGNGGVKGDGPYQDYPDCLAAVETMEHVELRFMERLKAKEIAIDRNGKLAGDLDFS